MATSIAEIAPLPRWITRQGQRPPNARALATNLTPGNGLAEAPDVGASSLGSGGAGAAFQAGAALLALDGLVRADPPWRGAWRMRQALAATAVAARHLRLREDAAALRDAHQCAGSGGGRVDPGPAGRLYRLVRDLARWPTRLAGEGLDRLAAELGLSGAGSWLYGLSGHVSPIVVATAVAEAVSAAGGLTCEGEVLAWRRCCPGRSARVVRPGAAARDRDHAFGPRKRPARPTHPPWRVRLGHDLSSCLRACRDRGARIGPRHCRPVDPADRGARRLLERLVAQGGLRELTGRPTFRLYAI